MDIVIGVTVSNDLKSTAVARVKELLVKDVASLPFVMSAVILHNTTPPHPLGWQRYEADESTRQSR